MHTICHLKLSDMINNLEIFINWEPEAPVKSDGVVLLHCSNFIVAITQLRNTAAVCSPNSGAALISGVKQRISLDNQRSDIFHATVVPLNNTATLAQRGIKWNFFHT